jgi:predicted transcriptional regulator
MSKLVLHVGESLNDAAARFVDGWKRVERGDLAESETHISFESWEALTTVLTPKRVELLRHLHRNPATSILALSKALGRDYKAVHGDVKALEAAGLVDQTEDGLRADYDEIRTTLSL